MTVSRILYIHKFLLIFISTLVIASIFPCTGELKKIIIYLNTLAITLLFFIHGAKLSSKEIFYGIMLWKLHLVIFLSTFVLFPLLGLTMYLLVPSVMTSTIYFGFLYLCALPSAVQSSVTLTSAAGGNVTAAICSASTSSILGLFLSPLLVKTLIYNSSAHYAHELQTIGVISLKLIVPFIIGYLMYPLIGKWIDGNPKLINIIDKLTILLIVYSTFSAAIEKNLWNKIDALSLIIILISSILLLLVVIIINSYVAQWLGFDTPEKITIVFCGSKKSLVNGIPMANVLFPSDTIGLMVLPLMIFYQVELIVCTLLAKRYANKKYK